MTPEGVGLVVVVVVVESGGDGGGGGDGVDAVNNFTLVQGT